jgi:hypothetical protein
MRSIGQQVFNGLLAGCLAVMCIELYFDVRFHYFRIPREIRELIMATDEVLFITGFALLIASLAMSFSKPKLGGWGLIVGVLAILAASSSPANYVRS